MIIAYFAKYKAKNNKKTPFYQGILNKCLFI